MTVRRLIVPAPWPCCWPGSPPPAATDPATDLRAQVREVQRIHEHGMAGLEIASQNSREDIGGYLYFATEPLLQRAGLVFGKAGWRLEVANEYLQFLDVVIREEMTAGKKHP